MRNVSVTSQFTFICFSSKEFSFIKSLSFPTKTERECLEVGKLTTYAGLRAGRSILGFF